MSSPWPSASVWVSKAKRALTKAEAEAQGKKYIPMETNQSAGVSLRLCVNYMIEFPYIPCMRLTSRKVSLLTTKREYGTVLLGFNLGVLWVRSK